MKYLDFLFFFAGGTHEGGSTSVIGLQALGSGLKAGAGDSDAAVTVAATGAGQAEGGTVAPGLGRHRFKRRRLPAQPGRFPRVIGQGAGLAFMATAAFGAGRAVRQGAAQPAVGLQTAQRGLKRAPGASETGLTDAATGRGFIAAQTRILTARGPATAKAAARASSPRRPGSYRPPPPAVPSSALSPDDGAWMKVA